MKTSLTDWLVTALAYIVICAVLSIINNEEDKVPGANQPQLEPQAASASQAAASLHASVSAQLAAKSSVQHAERNHLRQLAQEAERMTGFGASVQ